MSTHVHRVLLTALLSAGVALVAVRPAHAQLVPNPLQASVDRTTVSDPGSTAFLTAGMAGQDTTAPDHVPARNPRHEGLGIGAKGGFLFASFDEANEDFKNNNGFLAGIFFGGNRPGTVGVMGEVQYGKKGAKEGDFTIDQYFLEIPILLRLNAGSNSLNGVLGYFIVGPAFDINLQTKLNGVKVSNDYESLDVGVLVGGGVEITRFLVEARYNKGVRNVLKREGTGSTDLKTHSFAVEFGVRFN